jgi:hypothetical protein
LNDKWGFNNKQGVEICECKYDQVFHFCDGYARVEIDFKCGYIDKNGIEVIKCEHNSRDASGFLDKYKLNKIRIKKLKNIV